GLVAGEKQDLWIPRGKHRVQALVLADVQDRPNVSLLRVRVLLAHGSPTPVAQGERHRIDAVYEPRERARCEATEKAMVPVRREHQPRRVGTKGSKEPVRLSVPWVGDKEAQLVRRRLALAASGDLRYTSGPILRWRSGASPWQPGPGFGPWLSGYPVKRQDGNTRPQRSRRTLAPVG